MPSRASSDAVARPAIAVANPCPVNTTYDNDTGQCEQDPDSSGGSSGTTGGSAPVNTGGSGGGSQVASTKPAPGETCDGSPVQLGTSDLSNPTTGVQGNDPGSTVSDIWGLKPEGNATYATGWVYQTKNGTYWMQNNVNAPSGNSALYNFLSALFTDSPYVGPAITNLLNQAANAAAQANVITPTQFNDIKNQLNTEHQTNGTGPLFHSCFTGPLTT